MANSQVEVKVVLSKKQFFCDIHFKVVTLVSGVETPVGGVAVKLYTLAGENIMGSVTDSLGELIMHDMPVGDTYVWKVTHPDYDSKDGLVTTV